MVDVERGEIREAFERALLRAAAEKMRAAAALIDGGALPSDESLTDAGVLCADVGTLLESVYDERLEVRAESDAERDAAQEVVDG